MRGRTRQAGDAFGRDEETTRTRQEGRTAVLVTERAVFRAVDGALELSEIAPGVDLERDIVSHMAARPRIAANLQIMDRRLFAPEPTGLIADMQRKREAGAGTGRRLRAVGCLAV
jgi:acyl CoA:acetate/3-ketoacid CoA transferase